MSDAPWRPLWWWFIVHGAIISAWGVFALVTTVPGGAGWVLDGIAFGVMLLIGGVQLVVQGWSGRRYGPGWPGIFVGGIVPICFGTAIFVIAATLDATAVFWTIIAFLFVEGGVFIVGTWPGPVFRFWGLLMGGIVCIAFLVMLVLFWLFGGDFEILDPAFGALGVLYGMAMIVAAVQARQAGIERGPGRPLRR
ncbi:MAG: hypothetical protein J7480_02260 [Microbacteriaceae bacterium]|nr:hypothetical protein [Microbacteriaceae bacterium]